MPDRIPGQNCGNCGHVENNKCKPWNRGSSWCTKWTGDGLINLGGAYAKEKVEALHENLDHALSCLSGMPQPMMSTSPLTEEDEIEANLQMGSEMFEAVEHILESLYGGKNGSGFVFKV